MCSLLRVSQTYKTLCCPCSNGQFKRMNHAVLQMIHCFLNRDQHALDGISAIIAIAILSTVNSNTGFTNNIMFCRAMTSPANIVLPLRATWSYWAITVWGMRGKQWEIHEVDHKHLSEVDWWGKVKWSFCNFSRYATWHSACNMTEVLWCIFLDSAHGN